MGDGVGLGRLLGGMISELSPNMGINIVCVTEYVTFTFVFNTVL